MEHQTGEPAHDLPTNRVEYYQHQVEQLLAQYGREFRMLAQGYEQLVGVGDAILAARQGTGYNLVRSDDQFPVDSDERLIFYSNYIGRPRHFGVLLATMERDGIIQPEQIGFGVKASKVLYGGWELDPAAERLSTIERAGEPGPGAADQVSQSVETVVQVRPRTAAQAIQIARSLVRLATQARAGAIAGSWEVPDIRATAPLRAALSRVRFSEVVANLYRQEQAMLVVARQRTRLQAPWQPVAIAMNPELATYLAFGDVPA